MFYLIIAQAARAAVIWTTNYTAKKVLKTVAYAAVSAYLVERIKQRKQLYAARKGDNANN